MNWRDKVLQESAQVARLAKNPAKINRQGKSRRTQCKGGCGRRVWGDYCRKCSRAIERKARKAKRRKELTE
jgi:hypothetical protein